jgi:hypothetical protein
MSRNSSWGRIAVLLVLLVVLVGGVGGYFYFFHKRAERTLTAGTKAYDEGVKALDAKEGEQAVARFDVAILQAQKVLDEMEKEQNSSGAATPEKAERRVLLSGLGYWLKARALRDRAYAQGLVDNKPVREVDDTTSGEKFRSVLRIPDAEDRGEAVECLIQAADRLNGMKDVQQQALRTATMLSNWVLIDRYARAMLDLDDMDTRANMQLALFDYEQPRIDASGNQVGGTSPPEKRSARRMLEARTHLEDARKTKNYKFWRGADLDAKITSWLLDYYVRSHEPAKALVEEKRLRDLVARATEQAKQEKDLTRMAIFDVEGMLGLHMHGVEDAARTALKVGGDTGPLRKQLDGILTLCEKVVGGGAKAPFVKEATTTALKALAMSRPALLNLPPEEWKPRMDRGLTLADKARGLKVADPKLYVSLVNLLDREAAIAGKRGGLARQHELGKQAGQWITDGLRICKEAGYKDEQLAELNILAAMRNSRKGAKLEDLAPYLDPLRKLKTDNALAVVSFIEGVNAERPGRIDQASRLFIGAEKKGFNPLAVDMPLSNIHLSLGQPEQALARLCRVAKRYEKFEKLSDSERAWALEFIRSPADLQVLLVAANLATAQKNVREFATQSPGTPIPSSLIEPYEKMAAKISKALPARSVQARSVRAQ